MIGPAHHIGIAVKSLHEALEKYRALGLEPESIEDIPTESVRAAFLQAGGVRIELLESLRPDRKSTRLNSSHIQKSRMPSSA